MLSRIENFYATINGEKPDRFVKQYEAFSVVKGDPVNQFVRGNCHPGMEPSPDAWGTRIIWPAGEPGLIPDPNFQLLKDIETWQETIRVPDLIANCSAEALWEPFLERAARETREDTMLMAHAPVGVFERMHFLMGFEDTLVNFMVEPELMADLAMAIGEYRYNGFRLMVENMHPGAICTHDDWGGKTGMFVQPELWREILKPSYVKAYDYLHEQGVLIVHHCDSFCEPILEDMIDLHIDVWQGVLPQNDIVKLQQQGRGRIAFMGGLDSAVVDRDDSTEAEIRAETRRACETYGPGGCFIPCTTYGSPGLIHMEAAEIIDDEIDCCSRRMFGAAI